MSSATSMVLDSEADAQRQRIAEDISLSKLDFDMINGNRRYKDVGALALPMLYKWKLQVRALFPRSER